MKRYLLLSILSVWSLVISAQEVSFGIKAGPNLSSVSGSAQGLSSRIGYHAGIVSCFTFGNKVGVQAELIYSRQGFKIGPIEFRGDFDEAPAVFDVIENLDYLNLPILFHYQVADALYLQVGPQLGISIDSATTLKEIQGDASQFEDDFGQGIELDAIDIGLGGGLQLDISKFFIQGRFVAGLTAIDGQSGSKNTNLQLSFGYKI